MVIDRNDYTNSELEEMGLPLDDFTEEPEDDSDTLFPEEWLNEDHHIQFVRYFV